MYKAITELTLENGVAQNHVKYNGSNLIIIRMIMNCCLPSVAGGSGIGVPNYLGVTDI